MRAVVRDLGGREIQGGDLSKRDLGGRFVWEICMGEMYERNVWEIQERELYGSCSERSVQEILIRDLSKRDLGRRFI